MTNALIAGVPRKGIQELIASGCGQMLTDALLTGKMDTTAPIFIDAAQLNTSSQYNQDIQEIRIRLDYKERRDYDALVKAARERYQGRA